MTTFIGTPNMLVRLRIPIKRIKSFRFNSDGQFTTEDPKLIKRIGTKFAVLSDKNKAKEG